MVIRTVFWDAAGTLFELAEPVGQTYARIARQNGVLADPVELEQAFRRAWRSQGPPVPPAGGPSEDDDRSWWRTLVERTFHDGAKLVPEPAVMDRLFDALYEHYALAEAWRLFDDVVPALEALSGKFELHVLSNFDRRLLKVLSGLGIASYFATVTLSSVAGVSKPDARLFAHALKSAGAVAGTSLHVGDEMEADLKGALGAGMHAWRVERPHAGLYELTKNLLAGDYSCLQSPEAGV